MAVAERQIQREFGVHGQPHGKPRSEVQQVKGDRSGHAQAAGHGAALVARGVLHRGDQIVRVGRTFLFEPEDAARPYKPLVHGKKAFVLTARGDTGYGPGEPNAGMNHLDPYLRTIFGFIGITDLDFVHVDNDEFGGPRLEQSLGAAHERLATMLAAGVGA